jgi:hypothetical protein
MQVRRFRRESWHEVHAAPVFGITGGNTRSGLD